MARRFGVFFPHTLRDDAGVLMLRMVGFLVSLAVLALPMSADAQAPPFLLTWGSLGNGDGQFSEPRGIAVDGSGNVYVTDYFPHARIQVFDANGTFLRKWGSLGTGPGQFSQPEAVTVDHAGHVYVTDSGRERVQKFTGDGVFITQWGSFGTGQSEFSGISGIAADAGDNIYVVDGGNGRVQKFTSDGTFLLQWDVSSGQLGIAPLGIAVEPGGTVLVTVIGSPASIRRYSQTGAFLGELVTQSSAPGFAYSPAAVAVDPAGTIYEADGVADRAQAFTSAGSPIATWGSTGSGPGQFQTAIGIAVGPAGEIYVSDRLNYRIQKFGTLATPTVRSSWGRLKSIYR